MGFTVCPVCGSKMRLFLGPRPRYVCIREAGHPVRVPGRRHKQSPKRKAA